MSIGKELKKLVADGSMSQSEADGALASYEQLEAGQGKLGPWAHDKRTRYRILKRYCPEKLWRDPTPVRKVGWGELRVGFFGKRGAFPLSMRKKCMWAEAGAKQADLDYWVSNAEVESFGVCFHERDAMACEAFAQAATESVYNVTITKVEVKSVMYKFVLLSGGPKVDGWAWTSKKERYNKRS